MGLCLSAKGYKQDLNIGYIGFGWIRQCIATSYNEEFGRLYEKPYKDFRFKGYTQEEIDRWNEICDDDLDILLNHSDCDGKLTYQECGKIIKALDKIDFKYSDDWREDYKEKYYILKDMIRYCAKSRRTLWFY